jgi:galactokinase
MTRNALAEREDFLAEVKTREDLCGYMGAVESGYGFGSFLGGGGVGTAGGSEDHTAILSARAGKLLRCSFLPVKIERELPLPAGYVFVVGVSGIVADKTGNALERYNRASRIAKTMLDRWKQTTGRKDVSLAAALGSSRGAPDQLADMLKREWDAAPFINRLRQFREESDDIIPGVSAALERKDVSALGPLVDRSQALAEEVLENQTPETIALQRSARDLGAVAASAFGAGFGGSVWALIEAKRAEEFVPRWRESYLKKFPALQNRAEVFVTQAGPGLISLS